MIANQGTDVQRGVTDQWWAGGDSLREFPNALCFVFAQAPVVIIIFIIGRIWLSPRGTMNGRTGHLVSLTTAQADGDLGNPVRDNSGDKLITT
jgi:hypothetical protein